MSLFDEGLDRNKWDAYTDLYGLGCPGGGTVPNILVSYEVKQRPDLVLVDTSAKKCVVFELTVPFETNTNDAHARKMEKYRKLCDDIRNSGFDCTLLCFEAGSRGLITKDNRLRLQEFFHLAGCEVNAKTNRLILKAISQIAVRASYSIFMARKRVVWHSPAPVLIH